MCLTLHIDGKQTGKDEFAPEIIKTPGKLDVLENLIRDQQNDTEISFENHVGMGHTRWATHGAPSVPNSHPHSSPANEFIVVHNGIITNCSALRKLLESKGYAFQSETDTECIPILIYHLWKTRTEEISFVELIEKCVQQLEGTFAIVVKVSFFKSQKSDKNTLT